MNGQQTILTLTIEAAGAITELHGVGFDGNEATVEGQKIAGIAHFAGAAGEEIAVDSKGTVIAEAGGGIAVGDTLVIDATGRVILDPGTAGYFQVGEAMQAAAAAGDFIEVLMR